MNKFERITSKDNELIKSAAHLVSSTKQRKIHNKFVLDGLRLCMDALLNGFPIDTLIVSDTAFNKYSNEARMLSEGAKRAVIVPDLIIDKISDTTNPQGFICICNKPEIKENYIKNNGVYIALENMSDPSNLGAVARSAEAFALDAIIISDKGCDPYSSKALRASMGALLRIPVILITDFTEFIKNTSLTTYAAVLDSNADDIRNVNFKKGCIALIGNEANGLTDEIISVCNSKITIPMTGKAESLNAATAAAIIMWELTGRE